MLTLRGRHTPGEVSEPRERGVATSRGSVAQGVRSTVRTEVAISLRVKAMSGAALLIAASSGAIGVSVLRAARTEMTRAYEGQIAAVIDRAAQSVAPSLAGEFDHATIARTVEAAIATDGVTFCACYSRGGELLGLGERPLFDPPLTTRFGQSGPMTLLAQHLTTARGEAVAVQMAPVTARVPIDMNHGDEPASDAIGSLLIGATSTPVESSLAELARHVWTIVGAVAAASALLAWLVARSLVRPIHALLAGTERIVAGEFDHRVDVATRDELALLARYAPAAIDDQLDSDDARDVFDRGREGTRVMRLLHDPPCEMQVRWRHFDS